MKLIPILLFITTIICYSQDAYKYPYFDGIPCNVFKERREKVQTFHTDKTVLLFMSSDFFSNTHSFQSRKTISPNLYYLTGMPPQKAAVLLIPKGINLDDKKITEILFLENQSESDIKWNGYKISIADAGKILQIQKAMNISSLDSILKQILKYKDTLYFDKLTSTKHFSNDENQTECEITTISKVKTNFPNICIKTNIPLLSQMRQIKDTHEIKLIQKAIDISIEGHNALIKTAKPGKTEFQLQAEMEYQFLVNGADGSAYGSIVGTGRNSCFLHYRSNRDTVKDGDLILFDCGARYYGYCADITRTIPANGVFSVEQKIIYNIVLEAMDSAFAVCKPGSKFKDIRVRAKDVIAERLVEQSIITNKDDVDRYFPHGTSHFIGLNVHDSGPCEYLEPGNVLTIEPGIYIPYGSNCDERWWNIGIRIEDNILITKKGYINLSEKLPKTTDEIERLMK